MQKDTINESNSDLLTKFCSEGSKFFCLREILQNLSIDDLQSLTEDDVVESTPDNLKLTMRIFYRTIEAYVQSNNSYDSDDTDYYVDLSGKMLSSVYTETIQPGLTPMSMLFECLKPHISNMSVIDLSSNGLHIDDVSYILNAIRCFDFKPDTKLTIKLNCNSIRSFSKDFEDLLNLDIIKYVTVLGNVCASFESKSWFEKGYHLNKLIWINKVWICNSYLGWKTLIPNN